jgi:hypothetical protein
MSLPFFLQRNETETLFILFFFTRKEPKENRRRANRSLLPALCLRNGFQGTLYDLLPIDLTRFGNRS